jgi:hypothetical protein
MKRQIKYLTPAFFASCIFLTACNNSNPTDNSTTNIQTTMDSVTQKIEANKQLVRLWILDGWNNNRNKEVVDQVFAQDWVDGNPTFATNKKHEPTPLHNSNFFRWFLG